MIGDELLPLLATFKIMDELLKLLKKKESKIGNGLMSIRMFTDGSGLILAETEVEIFEFDSYEELIKYLKKQ